MMGLMGGVRRSIESIRDRIIRDLIKRQMPELNQKIDELLKPPKLNRIMIRELGLGKKIGSKIGRIGAGLSLIRSRFFR